MISCTEFVPAYSELFTFIENKHGRAAVDEFWKYLFAPDGKGIPLISFLEKEGIRGAFSYWSGSLNEEAADFTMALNERCGWFSLKMHRCPSKGKLLELRDKIGITPYHDYCLHCDHYRAAAEKAGLKYIYDFEGADHASCSILIYDPNRFDGRIIVYGDTVVMKRSAEDNEYFHRDFHSSMNMGVSYLAERYSERELCEYLKVYTENVYQTHKASIEKDGPHAILRIIKDTYEKEKATDALSYVITEDKLVIKIAYCPAIKHLVATGREISPHYSKTTSVIMKTFADWANLDFEMISYDEDTGAAEYAFFKKLAAK